MCLWQKPKKRITDPDGHWYDNVPLSKESIGSVMKVLSEKAELSEVYTNHSIRHYVIDTLEENNFEARHIIAVTGHKSESSIRQYTSKCPTKKQCEMSDCLASNLESTKKKPVHKQATATTTSTAKQNESTVYNLQPKIHR